MDLEIKPRPKKTKDVIQRPLQKDHTIPCMLSSNTLVGASGSGKTTLLMNLLCDKRFLRGCFDEIYLFSHTGHSDDSFKELGLDDDFIITEDMIPRLTELIDKAKEESSETSIYDMVKRCVIFEDVTANKKLMASKAFTECFTQCRHYGMTVFACSHKYKALQRTARLQATNLFIFPASSTDVEQIGADFTPAGLNKKQMTNMIEQCFISDNKGKDRPFLHINTKCPLSDRFRKKLGNKINIDYFKK